MNEELTIASIIILMFIVFTHLVILLSGVHLNNPDAIILLLLSYAIGSTALFFGVFMEEDV